MTIKTIAGPFNQQAAKDTAEAIGRNCSVYSIERKDVEGYGTGEHDYWVEQDDTLPSGKLFGYSTEEFMAKQHR